MKPPLFIVAVILSLVPLVLTVNLITMSKTNIALQSQLQSQQEDINKGSMLLQVGQNMLKDMAQASVKDEAIKDVLAKSGYTVTVNGPTTSSSSAATSSPTPNPIQIIMSDEFSSDNTSASGGFKMDAFIPLVLLAISFIVLLGWQISNTSSQRKQLEDAITHQQLPLNQSHQVQAGITKLANDLIEVAKTDGTARAIASKYFQQNGQPAAPAAPAASPQ